jgi:hypothetical protein
MMARRVFFSFHYQRDIWRVNNVRNSWVSKGVQEAGWIDAAAFEEIQRRGDDAVKRWIDSQMNGTSVTVVLIGSETATRRFVDYEIAESFRQKKGLLGVYIHNIKDQFLRTDSQGSNPLAKFKVGSVKLTDIFATYDWVRDNGRDNIGAWIDDAARRIDR